MHKTIENYELKKQQVLYHRELKRRIWGFAIGVCVLIAVFMAFMLLQQESVQKEYIYPATYREYIVKYSDEYEVDPYLVVAVIKAESKFKHNATSNYGAVGLMQLMPSTAVWIAGQLDDTGFSPSDLQQPECNIRYGSWYLHSLRDEFQGNEILMLAAYNAGRGNVMEWMKKYGWDYRFDDVESIPFQETKEYVKNVLKHKARYKALYPNELK